jgi:hypothetical protein
MNLSIDERRARGGRFAFDFNTDTAGARRKDRLARLMSA